MIKVYIAGPMSGYPELNVEAFNHAEDVLIAAGVEPLNPARIVLHEEATWLDYMRATTRLLTTANEVLLLPGWEQSKGASIEWHWAKNCGLEVHTLAWWQRKAGMTEQAGEEQ